MDQVIKLDCDGQQFDVFEASPVNSSKGGVIVIHEVWSLNDHTKDVARRLVKAGYSVLAPDLLSELDFNEHADTLQLDLFNPAKRHEAQPKLRALMAPMQAPDFAERTISKLKCCFELLYNKPEIDHKIAVIGFCFGGSYSFQLAIHEPRLKLAIPFYGHVTSEIDALKQINCPVRAFYGETDENLIAGLPKLQENMKAANVDFEAKVYPKAGHAFFNDTNPFAYNQKAAENAWPIVLDYLETYLAS